MRREQASRVERCQAGLLLRDCEGSRRVKDNSVRVLATTEPCVLTERCPIAADRDLRRHPASGMTLPAVITVIAAPPSIACNTSFDTQAERLPSLDESRRVPLGSVSTHLDHSTNPVPPVLAFRQAFAWQTGVFDRVRVRPVPPRLSPDSAACFAFVFINRPAAAASRKWVPERSPRLRRRRRRRRPRKPPRRRRARKRP